MKEFNAALKSLSEAHQRLGKALALPPTNEVKQDAVIKRFEFTFELLWKTLRLYHQEKEGIIANSPKKALQEAFRVGLIKDEAAFLDMLEDRNRSAHVYDKDDVADIFRRIEAVYFKLIGEMIKKL